MNLMDIPGGLSEVFTPYVRITNSYNGTRALRVDVGFLRKHCGNGVIFEQQAATLSVPHTRQGIRTLKVARPFTGMAALREKFANALAGERAVAVTQDQALQLVRLVIGWPKLSEDPKAWELSDQTRLDADLETRLGGYPIAITRNLDRAKEWIRSKARGSERYGLIASSKALRLKPQAIDIRVEIDPVIWFLNDREDVRSSYYLEDAATEFQVQRLELDWTCVTWDGDFRLTKSGWSHHDFRGTSWCNIHKSENQKYLQNAYRDLLTRARQGMVIFVPQGDSSDPTRSPAYYDSTFHYLSGLGLPTLT